jgi:hypothetical protein
MGLFSRISNSWEQWKTGAVLAAQAQEQARLRQAQDKVSQSNQAEPDTSMNEGDFHSGPAGYSPNTAYPETQYGSGFDEEADWNEEH